jgi:hypothetical protein
MKKQKQVWVVGWQQWLGVRFVPDGVASYISPGEL